MVRYSLILLTGLVYVAGCQNPSIVSRVPSPNFNGPTVAQPTAPGPRQPALPPPATPWPAPTQAKLDVPRGWIPSARPNAWRWIVIHHSATSNGSAAKFDRDHRAKGWDELGYHFVIGNGNGSGNGQVEVGSRWPRQKWGAHAKTPDNRFNEYGIGICLVGNFDVSRPTPQQQQSLARLVAYLMQTYNIPADRVIGHRDAKSTACPGRNFSIPWLRREALALMGAESRPLRTAAIGELMR